MWVGEMWLVVSVSSLSVSPLSDKSEESEDPESDAEDEGEEDWEEDWE